VRIIILLFISFIFPHFTGNHSLQPYHISGYAQGTTYHVTYYASDSLIKQKDTDSILRAIDSSLSIYKSYSLITRFNNAEKGIKMDKHLQLVVKRSLEVYKSTNGTFDITVYPLVNAWGFGPQKPSGFPDSNAVGDMLKCVGSKNLRIQDNFLQKNMPCLKIDVNGIAQGYSVDVVADFLEKKKIKTYLVDIGGEIRVNGRKPNGELMKIGIEMPAEDDLAEPAFKKIIGLEKGAVTTSGNYRKYIEKGNGKISHLINPKSGYPYQNEMVSVTIIAKDAITADGYDNALMGMGLKGAMKFMKAQTDMYAYFIYKKPDGSIADTATVGFYKFIKEGNANKNGP
jgi:thiamine biosynthesis lipoprotein